MCWPLTTHLSYHHLCIIFGSLESSLSHLLVCERMFRRCWWAWWWSKQWWWRSAGHVGVALLQIVHWARLGSPQSVISFSESVTILLLWRVRQTGECPGLAPLTSLTLAVAVVVSEEILSVHTSDLLTRNNVSQHLDTRAVSTRGHELAVGSAVVVDVCRGAQPELSTVLATTEHDWEVILPRHQQLSLLLLTQLSNAANQISYVVSWQNISDWEKNMYFRFRKKIFEKYRTIFEKYRTIFQKYRKYFRKRKY